MTDVSRRALIGAGAVALGAIGGVVGPVGVAPGSARAADPTYTSAGSLYRRPRFEALSGKGFSLVRGGIRTPVTLREVADLDGAPTDAAAQFRLTFTCRGAVPEQGTYSLRRIGFAATSLFLVPDPVRRGMTAVINSAR